MNRFAIRTEAIGKQYRIGSTFRPNFREALISACSAPKRYISRLYRRPAASSEDGYWAVRDVSLEIHPGELVGLVGANGAGKSTLLKMLSRITSPSAGRALIRGRVGSMLEVGTGFHSELTGRENVFLSGAILGMSKVEIRRKFDEIVAFSEIEKFIETPVKHYSSGMYLRLAFSVAAHLEPEVLLVDEVLAVGDITFQKKCMGKMGDVARQGRTIILVSHNMAAINSLCSRCMIVQEGRIAFDGRTSEATTRYYADSLSRAGDGSDLSTMPRDGNGKAKFSKVVIEPLDPAGEPCEVAYPGC